MQSWRRKESDGMSGEYDVLSVLLSMSKRSGTSYMAQGVSASWVDITGCWAVYACCKGTDVSAWPVSVKAEIVTSGNWKSVSNLSSVVCWLTYLQRPCCIVRVIRHYVSWTLWKICSQGSLERKAVCLEVGSVTSQFEIFGLMRGVIIWTMTSS